MPQTTPLQLCRFSTLLPVCNGPTWWTCNHSQVGTSNLTQPYPILLQLYMAMCRPWELHNRSSPFPGCALLTVLTNTWLWRVMMSRFTRSMHSSSSQWQRYRRPSCQAPQRCSPGFTSSNIRSSVSTHLFCFCLPVYQFSFIHGDHLSGKPRNVREFDSCQGNVRDFTKSRGNSREKWPKTVYC